MKIPVYNQLAEIVSEIETPEIFDQIMIKPELIHQAARWQILNSYYPFAHTKNRGDVRGGGRKPWRQKGTGRARHGSRRSPIWRGGGITFGPRNEEDKSVEIPKKMRRKAILMVVAGKLKSDSVRVIENIKPNDLKTKSMEKILAKFLKARAGRKKDGEQKKFESALIALTQPDQAIIRITANLSYVETIEARNLNILALLNHRYLILEPSGLGLIEKTFTLVRSKSDEIDLNQKPVLTKV